MMRLERLIESQSRSGVGLNVQVIDYDTAPEQ